MEDALHSLRPLYHQVSLVSGYHIHGGMWQAMGLQTCGIPELSPCNQRLPAAPAAWLAKECVRGVRVGSLWLYLLASNGGSNLLLPHCCTASLHGFCHNLLWLLRQEWCFCPSGLLIMCFSPTLPLLLCKLVLGGRGGTLTTLWLCFLSSNGSYQCTVATLLCHVSACHLV